MTAFKDNHHRPHAIFIGEEPETEFTRGPESLRVTLDAWGPRDFEGAMARYLDSNWGEEPVHPGDENPALVEDCFAGRTLQQVLEGLTFWFTIDGVTRAATHQIVRTREAAFMQHGGRDNDWRHRGWTMPETIARACDERDGTLHPALESCIIDPIPITYYLYTQVEALGLQTLPLSAAIRNHITQGKVLYAALVDAGIPWQDARRVLTIGTQTYIHAIYDYRTLGFLLANRLEHVMDWEINCIAQLMLRAIRTQCPPVVGRYLGSASDRAQKAMFAGMSSWPPDGKYPVPAEMAHIRRQHTPAQMPFFVLDPACMRDATLPIRWIPTNGTFPSEGW